MPPVPSSTDNSFVVMMIVVILILALAIILLANVVLGAAQYRLGNPEGDDGPGAPEKPGRASENGPAADASARAGSLIASGPAAASNPSTGFPPAATLIAGIIIAATMLISSPVAAQSTDAGHASAGSDASTVTAGVVTSNVNGLSDTAFYVITGVIFLEVLIVLGLLYNLRKLIAKKKKTAAAALVAAKPTVTLWDKVNSFKPIEQEKDILLGHDYDGIRELDNRLPPWWIYGFYCTIIFACIYLYRYHIGHTAPLSAEEYAISVQKAQQAKADYLKKAANNVDETTVKLLTDPASLAAGKTVFESICFACHGKHGEGGVGPNLTDDYWLHGGSIQDVFKTIKYGWPDKGMKSWKDDFSPSQIQQIASYVKSLHGTNPDNAKAPQGTLSK